jgi:hypothetical protein
MPFSGRLDELEADRFDRVVADDAFRRYGTSRSTRDGTDPRIRPPAGRDDGGGEETAKDQVSELVVLLHGEHAQRDGSSDRCGQPGRPDRKVWPREEDDGGR